MAWQVVTLKTCFSILFEAAAYFRVKLRLDKVQTSRKGNTANTSA